MSDPKNPGLENSFVASENHPLYIEHTIVQQKLTAQLDLLAQIAKSVQEIIVQHDKHGSRLDINYIMRRVIAIREITALGQKQLKAGNE